MDLKTEALKLHAKHQGKLTTVLGLGNIGHEAALPVMEGKAALFKTFANLDAFPICLFTGRSDFPNQINNALAFQGVFKRALQAKAKRITEKMKVKAAEVLASLAKKPTVDKIIPSIFDKGVTETVAKAVAQAATVRK